MSNRVQTTCEIVPSSYAGGRSITLSNAVTPHEGEEMGVKLCSITIGGDYTYVRANDLIEALHKLGFLHVGPFGTVLRLTEDESIGVNVDIDYSGAEQSVKNDVEAKPGTTQEA